MHPDDFVASVATFATGVVIVTVREGRDDIGTTVTAFAAASLEPPMVMVSIAARSYVAEVLTRRSRWAATVLAAPQQSIAGRFAAAGRPSARLLVANVPHHRGPISQALIIDGGLASLECETRHRVRAGDHVLFVAEVAGVEYNSPPAPPLIRFQRRYHAL